MSLFLTSLVDGIKPSYKYNSKKPIIPHK